ncbi:hypothetical protein [Acidisphaera sp. S103]|uniref:hypothetical protein n=1 Tax=Acidisphaera sp. S103 TaxID=1747223 RepID=UPI00131B9A21|nr:hypothetical protein [Acidisphaera sp. S103]
MKGIAFVIRPGGNAADFDFGPAEVDQQMQGPTERVGNSKAHPMIRSSTGAHNRASPCIHLHPANPA